MKHLGFFHLNGQVVHCLNDGNETFVYYLGNKVPIVLFLLRFKGVKFSFTETI